MRFKTSQADGLLFFADGNQGDYLILEMVRGRLYLNYDLGTCGVDVGGVGIWWWNWCQEFGVRFDSGLKSFGWI